jgi:peptidoglycan hydrolase-like protein with peptidoglycan-binding domain
LNDLGANPPLTTDGIDGPLTSAAIKAFQSANGLTVDGIVGPQTLAALGFAGATAMAGTGGSNGGASTPSAAHWVEIPDKSTPLTADQAAKAFNAAYQKVTGKVPSPDILNLLLSQSAFETGNWGAGIHNYNFGNKKATSGDAYIQYFPCSEVINGVNQMFYPPDPMCRFAAYKSATDGAVAYIKLLQERSNWWNGLQGATVASFVAGLSSSPAYFTADPTQYANGLSTYFSKYGTLAQQYAVPIANVIGMLFVAAGVGLAAIVGIETFQSAKKR